MSATSLTDEQMAALTEERRVTEEYPVDQARRILELHLPAAAQVIVNLAIHSSNDRVRFQAAQYVVERGLGKETSSPDKPLEKFIDEITDYVSKA